MTELEFHQLYADYAPAVRARCRAMFGNSVDADDALQETFLKAWKARRRFDGRHPLAWLQTIGRNTCLNMIRRRRPWQDDPATWLKLPDAKATDPRTLSDATRILDRFKPQDAAILRLRHAENWRIAEIAEHLGTSQRSVRRRLERIEQRARALINIPEAA